MYLMDVEKRRAQGGMDYIRYEDLTLGVARFPNFPFFWREANGNDNDTAPLSR